MAGGGSDESYSVVVPSRPAAPILIHAPHGGRRIPPEVRADLLLDDGALEAELQRMTDHRTDELAEEVATECGVWAFVNRLSRLVVDPERFTDPEQEVMEQRGMGAVYTSKHDRRPLRDLSQGRRDELLDRYFHPYATALADTVTTILDAHGRCLIIDLHSYPREPLPYELDATRPRPPLCIGSDDFHTPDGLARTVERVAADHGLATARDTPFAGTYVPLERYRRDNRVTSVMIEIRRDVYVQAQGAAQPGWGGAAAFLVTVVRELAAKGGSDDRAYG